MGATLQNTTLVVKTAKGEIPNNAQSVNGAGDMAQIARFFEKLAAGFSPGLPGDTQVDIHRGTTDAAPVAASGTITLATCVAGTAITINGSPFTAVSGTPGPAEFDISGDDTADAVSLAAQINASTAAAIAGQVVATSALGVVTVTSVRKGVGGNSVKLEMHGVHASGTITCATVIATNTIAINGTTLTGEQERATGTVTFVTSVVGNTVTVNGYTFTAVAGAVATGTPYFSIDTSDTATATSLAAQINSCASALISGLITATSAVGVVTLRAVTHGTAANSYTLAKVGAPISVSNTTLLGGLAIANNKFDTSPGATNAQMATEIVRAINASSTALVSSHVQASVDGTNTAIVNVRAKYDGIAGNAITLASSGATLAVSAARFTGGAAVNTRATGTVTISGGSGNYTCTINGVNASGTVAFNTSDNQTASDLCDAINKSSSALVRGVVVASVATNVVTITAVDDGKDGTGGISGNAITLAATGTGATASVSRLAGGAAATTVVLSAGYLSAGVGGDAAAKSFTF